MMLYLRARQHLVQTGNLTMQQAKPSEISSGGFIIVNYPLNKDFDLLLGLSIMNNLQGRDIMQFSPQCCLNAFRISRNSLG